ncbi:MAG: hypothetical protein M0C28_00170 [Candidatus Moduliflexus flocculans]|nr:hypothetical protein [Candidatus Moduliflexus flocculans]
MTPGAYPPETRIDATSTDLQKLLPEAQEIARMGSWSWDVEERRDLLFLVHPDDPRPGRGGPDVFRGLPFPHPPGGPRSGPGRLRAEALPREPRAIAWNTG